MSYNTIYSCLSTISGTVLYKIYIKYSHISTIELFKISKRIFEMKMEYFKDYQHYKKILNIIQCG